MESVTSRKVIVAKFSDEVELLFHFRIDTAKDSPIYCMEGAFVPVESVFVVIDKYGESGFGTNGCFETASDRDSIQGQHHVTLGVDGYIVLESRVLVELSGCKSIGLGVHLGVKR